MLIEAGHAAATVVGSIWNAPPIRIPGRLIDKKVNGDIEIPPALLLAVGAAFGLYVWARKNKIAPFDWLWARVDEAAAKNATVLTGAETSTSGATLTNENTSSATIRARIRVCDEWIAKIDKALETATDAQAAQLSTARAAYSQQRQGLIDMLTARGESYP